MYRVVIPARYGASRLPGKPLIRVAGKPMIQWVYERAQRSRASEVVIATDDERIAAAAREFGAPVVMTAITHLSGTDRIAEVAHLQRWEDEAIVVNVQGDEPLMPPELIEQAAALLEKAIAARAATSVSMPTASARCGGWPRCRPRRWNSSKNSNSCGRWRTVSTSGSPTALCCRDPMSIPPKTSRWPSHCSAAESLFVASSVGVLRAGLAGVR